jgi:hypothetical protein
MDSSDGPGRFPAPRPAEIRNLRASRYQTVGGGM